MRLFWALPAPDAFRTWMASLQGELRHRIRGARWADARQAHLTLCFLGEVEAAAPASILEAGRRALAGLPVLPLEILDWTAFPRKGQARVLAVALAPDTRLLEAHARLARAMAPFAALEDRPFRPHLTLARFKEPVKLPELPDPPPAPAWRAERAVLFRSATAPGGAVHEELGAAALRS